LDLKLEELNNVFSADMAVDHIPRILDYSAENIVETRTPYSM
jgi:hypothetical protein